MLKKRYAKISNGEVTLNTVIKNPNPSITRKTFYHSSDYTPIYGTPTLYSVRNEKQSMTFSFRAPTFVFTNYNIIFTIVHNSLVFIIPYYTV
jgi:hypothetical protein